MTLKRTQRPLVATKKTQPPEPKETPNIQTTIRTFTADLADIQSFLSISFSPTRSQKVEGLLTSTLTSLSADFDFDTLSQDDKVDYLLLQSHIKRLLHQQRAAAKKYQQAQELGLFGDWVDGCIHFVETRHNVGRQSGREIATVFQNAEKGIDRLISTVNSEKSRKTDKERFIIFWTIAGFEELSAALEEAVDFYKGYDPVVTWWIEKPWETLNTSLITLVSALKTKIGVDGSSSADDIVGDPIGREALLEELEAEWIAYTPEELIRMGENELEWCEKEMQKASEALGFDSHRDALEHVKNGFVEPGEQIHVVHDLASEAIAYISKHDLIAVPPVARDYWKTTMMTPARQRVNPFFLGGTEIIVSYPTNTMSHADKLMSMRGNSPAFSRSTVFHELIPGHHLQFHYMDRHNTHRRLFLTPFWIEGWAVYWELLLWDRGFPAEIGEGQKWATDEAENRIGMLFWRMHRCARIMFSL
jgi:uncharacterized protein (DUF885 family)